MNADGFPLEGGCDCKAVRYRMETRPLFVNCCHCRWCQRESGSAFALNAMIEMDRVTVLGEAPELVETPSASGKGQLIARCTRDTSTPGMCLSERRIEGADLTFRFPRSWLVQWRDIATAMNRLSAQMHSAKG